MKQAYQATAYGMSGIIAAESAGQAKFRVFRTLQTCFGSELTERSQGSQGTRTRRMGGSRFNGSLLARKLAADFETEGTAMSNNYDPWKRGIWCCRRGACCQWKGFALSKDGIAIGTIPHETDRWRRFHQRECGGELVQILEKEEEL